MRTHYFWYLFMFVIFFNVRLLKFEREKKMFFFIFREK